MTWAVFHFCSDKGENGIPSFAVNCPGQLDTISGERLSLEIIHAYNRLVNCQVNHNVDEHVIPLSEEEKRERAKIRKALAEEFALKNGYFPRKGYLDEQMRRKAPRTYVDSTDWLFEKFLKSEDDVETEEESRQGVQNDDHRGDDGYDDGNHDDGDSGDGGNGDGDNDDDDIVDGDCGSDTPGEDAPGSDALDADDPEIGPEEDFDADVAADEDESGLEVTMVGRRDDRRVLEFASQFTGRQRAVLDMLIAKSNGEKTFGMQVLLARKWEVSPSRIVRDIRAIGEAFVAWLKQE